MNFGEVVATVRGLRGWTQVQLAERAGVDPATISHLETGVVARPHRGTIQKLAKALRVPPEALTDSAGARELIAGLRGGGQKKTAPRTSTPDKPVPVISWASAGTVADAPIWLDQGYSAGAADEWIERPANVRDRRAYAIRIEGDSMLPLLRPGDLVVIVHDQEPVAGDLVLVKTRDYRVFVKILNRRGDTLALTSTAPGYEPIILSGDELAFPPRKVAAILKR